MILTNSFKTDNRVLKEARTLVENGYEVEVLAWDREGELREKLKDEVEGIKVRRFFIETKYGTGIKQLIGFYKFCLSIRKYLKDSKFDILHCHDLDGAIVGYFVKSKVKIIDLHEFYDNENLNFFRRNLQKIIGDYFIKKFNKIIVCSDFQKDEYSLKTTKEILVLYNYPLKKEYIGFKKKKDDKNIRIRYAGVVRDFYSLSNLIKIGNKFKNLKIYINGSGIALEKIKSLKRNENIDITGVFYPKELKKFYENTDLTYAVYENNRKNTIKGIAVKVYESLALRIPIIVMKNTVIGNLVEKYDIGFVVDEPIEKSLEELFKKILNNKNLIENKIENLNKKDFNFFWEEQEKNFINFYKNKKEEV